MTRLEWPRRIESTDPFQWRSNHGLLVLLLATVLLFALSQTLVVDNIGLGVSPAQVLFLLCNVLLVLAFAGGRVRIPALGSLLILQLAAFSASFAAANTRSLAPEMSADTASSLMSAGTIILATIFVMVVLRTVDDVMMLIRVVVLAGAVSGFAAILSSVTRIDLGAISVPGLRAQTSILDGRVLSREGVDRAQGTAQVPLELGSTMSVLLPLAVTCVVQAGHSSRSRALFLVAAALISGGALLSVSRTALLSAVFSLLVVVSYWPWHRVRVALWTFAGAAVVAVFAFGSLVGALALSVVTASSDPSLASRGTGRDYVFALFPQHPFFGQGLGTYQVGPQPILDNQYLAYLAETGLVGLVAALAVTIYAMALMVRLRRHPSRQTRDLAGGLLGALVALVIYRSVQDTDAFVQISYLGAMVVGAAGALWHVHRPDLGDHHAAGGTSSTTMALPRARVPA